LKRKIFLNNKIDKIIISEKKKKLIKRKKNKKINKLYKFLDLYLKLKDINEKLSVVIEKRVFFKRMLKIKDTYFKLKNIYTINI
jgi:hypothetical protein